MPVAILVSKLTPMLVAELLPLVASVLPLPGTVHSEVAVKLLVISSEAMPLIHICSEELEPVVDITVGSTPSSAKSAVPSRPMRLPLVKL